MPFTIRMPLHSFLILFPIHIPFLALDAKGGEDVCLVYMYAKEGEGGVLEGWGEDVYVDLQISWFLSEIMCHAYHDYLIDTLHPMDAKI